MTSTYVDLSALMENRSGLTAPKTYWNASGEKRRRNCNGCGTEGWKGAMVPDTIWGLRISKACDIHDWMYAEGTSEADKQYADMLFLNNMIAIIRVSSEISTAGWALKLVRERRAFTYYQAVSNSHSGSEAFNAARLK
jgi:hypothetical protein